MKRFGGYIREEPFRRVDLKVASRRDTFLVGPSSWETTMTHKTDSDGNPLHHNRERSQAGDDDRPAPELLGGQASTEYAALLTTCRMFQFFLTQDDGYLKVKRELDSDDVHFTWIWTMGKWARHYVYVRMAFYDACSALQLLEHKRSEVDRGLRHPTPDRYGR